MIGGARGVQGRNVNKAGDESIYRRAVSDKESERAAASGRLKAAKDDQSKHLLSE